MILVSMKSARHFCQVLMKLEIFLTDFRKIPNNQISTIQVQWEPSFEMRTDRQVTKLTVAFRNSANALKNKRGKP